MSPYVVVRKSADIVILTTQDRICLYTRFAKAVNVIYFCLISGLLFELSEFLIATCKKKKTDRLSVRMFG